MKVVVLYGNSTSQDLSLFEIENEWQRAAALADIPLVMRHYETFPTPEEFNSLVDKDADALLGVWITDRFLNKKFYDSHPDLTYIAGLAHGFQQIDWKQSRDRGITITNTPYGEYTIAEYAFSLLLEICKKTETSCRYVKNTDWNAANDKPYTFAITRQIELYKKTLGVVGLGKIGLHSAEIGRAFGMHVLGYNRHRKDDSEYSFIEQVPLDELFMKSDVITLHVSLNTETEHMIDRAAFEKMKDGVIIINTARGALIDENALCDALKSGKVYAAGLDVLTNEPPESGNPLIACSNALITPHIAWLPKTCRLRQISMAVETYRSYLDGKPVNVINGKF
ncbi:MAG: D-2-hydroxyacid dehydrogenase [Treponema sp.]|nr:D-2-hydroxyacid dehydrogenase [Treponema sp.]